jgi:hypothetical protein
MVVLKSPANRRPRMASIAHALERIKGNPLEILDRPMIERACRQCGHEWRERDLGPAATVSLFCQHLKVNPLRPNRVEPRCKKRRPKQYDLMNKPRAELGKTLKNSGESG